MHPAIAQLRKMFLTKGQEAYGEGVTVLQHSVQAGALAEQAGHDREVVAAAFLHDVGHLRDNQEQMGDLGVASHEKVGADLLRQMGFSEKIAALVAGHVQAKRYLTHRDAAYLANLSDASRQTLAWQGGPMNEAEAVAFAQHPTFALSIQMRQWDETAKDPTQPADAQLNHFLNVCAACLPPD